MSEDAAVCYAKSSRGAALTWTTLAFFAGFAGVSAFGPIVTKLKQSMALSPLLMGLLAASPAHSSDGDYFSNPNAEDVFESLYAIMHESDPERFKSIY